MPSSSRHSMARTLAHGALAVMVMWGLVRCDWTDPVEPERLVVEAFLETGQPLPPITLRRTRPLNAPGDDAASGAALTVTIDGTPVPYAEVPGRPGLYTPTERLQVPPDVPFELEAAWSRTIARARGLTPPPVTVQSVCVRVPDEPVRAILVDSLRRDSLDIPAEEGFIYPIDVELEWPADLSTVQPDTALWARAQLQAPQFSSRVLDFFLQPAEVRREINFPTRNNRRVWAGVYAVDVDSASDPLPEHRLTVTLTRGDTDFASFAVSRTDPDRREPISNVTGGLGIATAVAIDSLSRIVQPGDHDCVPNDPSDEPAPVGVVQHSVPTPR